MCYWHFFGLHVTLCDTLVVPAALLTATETEPPVRLAYLTVAVVGPSDPCTVPPVAVQTGAEVPPDDVSVNVQVNPLQDFESVAVGGEPLPPPPPLPAPMKPMYNSLLGVPAGTPLIALLVAFVVSAFVTSVALAVGLADR